MHIGETCLVGLGAKERAADERWQSTTLCQKVACFERTPTSQLAEVLLWPIAGLWMNIS